METDRVGFWLACNQRAVLREPQERYVDMVQEFSDVPEADIRFALAFLAAHDNLAASRMGKNLKLLVGFAGEPQKDTEYTEGELVGFGDF